MPTSSDTLLRRVKASHRSLLVSVRVLGVDDWAWKKGQRYGTILCDLERRRVIDLLAARSTVSFCSWLKSHPEDFKSRDPCEEYTKGCLRHPQSVPVADRFHLLINVRAALTRVVDRHHTHVSEVQFINYPSHYSGLDTSFEARGPLRHPRLHSGFRSHPRKVFSGEPTGWNATNCVLDSTSKGFR